MHCAIKISLNEWRLRNGRPVSCFILERQVQIRNFPALNVKTHRRTQTVLAVLFVSNFQYKQDTSKQIKTHCCTTSCQLGAAHLPFYSFRWHNQSLSCKHINSHQWLDVTLIKRGVEPSLADCTVLHCETWKCCSLEDPFFPFILTMNSPHHIQGIQCRWGNPRYAFSSPGQGPNCRGSFPPVPSNLQTTGALLGHM